jgi:potassium channel subfamily K, other eukaryote
MKNGREGGDTLVRQADKRVVIPDTFTSTVSFAPSGYGDMAPQRTISRLYVSYYVLAAVGLISTMLAFFVGLLIDKQESMVLASLTTDSNGSSSSDDGEEERPTIIPPPLELTNSATYTPWLKAQAMSWSDLRWVADYRDVVYTFAFFVSVLALGIWVFMHYEKLSFVDSLYVTVISATTLGFGDVGPTLPVTKAIMTVWLLVATITLGKLITDQSEAFVTSKQRAVTRRLLSARMDFDTLRGMDSDGDGRVDKAEFLVSCLLKLGKVEQEDVDSVLRRFKELDVDGSGLIDPNDISN